MLFMLFFQKNEQKQKFFFYAYDIQTNAVCILKMAWRPNRVKKVLKNKLWIKNEYLCIYDCMAKQ